MNPPEPFQRYLRLLGIEGHPTGLSGLRTLVRRHLIAIPFENISKLLLYDREHAGRPTTLAEYLDGIEFASLGGTCYTNNPFFADLLRVLGYDAALLGADMSQPDVHTCLRVRIDTVDYHVDVGFAAPFREPIRLDRLPVQIDEGSNCYVFDRDPDGAGFRMNMSSGGQPGAGYMVHDPPRPRESFDEIVLRSYSLSSTFMKRLRIGRVFEHYSVDLIDRQLYRHEEGKHSTVTNLESLSELTAAVRDHFAMPQCPIESAVAILERLAGRPFFAE